MPNMKKQMMPATRPARRFLRASFLSMWSQILTKELGATGSDLDGEDHRREQQREVQHREQVEAQRTRAIGAAVENVRTGEERQSEHHRADQIDHAEAAGAERQLGDSVEEK